MSFVKLPRKYPTKPQHYRKKKQKADWDATINDLSVHKATDEELARRKMVNTSANMEAVKADQMKSKLRQAQGRPSHNQRKTALLKEVLYDTSQLHDVLSKSDKMMSVVRDLFGDDPAKYKGLPHVTTAPQIQGLNSSDLPEGSIIEEPSKLDVLSEAIMNRSALNDLDSDCRSLESDDVGLDYKPALDFGRFQQLLSRADDEMEKERQIGKDGRRGQNMTDRLLKELAAKLVHNQEEDEPESPVSGAINDTQKIERSRSRLSREDQECVRSESREEVTSLDGLRQVLDGLENNIEDFEKMTGREPAVRVGTGEPSLTGFTERLVTAVNKVSKYLKENELRLRVETTLREQLHQNLTHTRSLVDTLTNDVIATQEQYLSLQSEFVRYKKESSEQIQAIKQALQTQEVHLQTGVQSTSIQSSSNDPRPQQVTHRPQQFVQQPPGDTSVVGRPQLTAQAYAQGPPVPNPVTQTGQQALSLGVPQQKDSPKQAGKQRSRLEHGTDGHSGSVPNDRSSQGYTGYPGQPTDLPSHSYTSSPGQPTGLPSHSYTSYPGQSTDQQSHSYTSYPGQPTDQQPQRYTSYHGQTTDQTSERYTGQPIPQPSVVRHTGNSLIPNSGHMLPIRQVPDTGRISPGEPLNQAPVLSGQPKTIYVQEPQQTPHITNPTVIRHPPAMDFQMSEFPGRHQIPQYLPQQQQQEQQQQQRHVVSDNMCENGKGHQQSTVQGDDGGMKVTEVQQEMSENLERQIEELNRQHAEAQTKLMMLMEHQQSVEGQNASVSPPISPITVDSDTENRPPLSHVVHKPKQPIKQTREIKIALPRVENIIELQNHRV